MLELIKRRCGIAEPIKIYDEDVLSYMEDAKTDMVDSGVPESIVASGIPAVVTAMTLYVKSGMADDRTEAERYMEAYRSKVFRLTLKEEGEEKQVWNKSITLMHQKEAGEDPDGFVQMEYVCMEHIPACFQDITRNDQLLAKQSGYEVDQNVEIMACNYQKETLLMDEETGAIYEIKRTFRPSGSSRLILTCQLTERGTVKRKEEADGIV